jgi:hypothetical protein
MDQAEISAAQRAICARYGVRAVPAPFDLKVGIATNVLTGLQPISGLRHDPKGDTTGWYIWAGAGMSSDPRFFEPLHVEHLTDWCAVVIPSLQLPPGYRFQIAPDHEDVWFDPSLVEA